MMTLHPLHGGDGYTYLTREVATADVRRERGQEITDYYHAEGNPPGIWVGSATAELDVEGTVTEAQMKALFGEGLHPNAEAMIEALVDEGMSADQAIKQVRLGRAPYRYQPKVTFAERCDQRYAAHERINGHAPDQAQRTRLRRAMAAQMFAEEHGRRPRNATELNKYLGQIAAPASQAVTGFDLVFTPPKSVSVLWALGDDATRRAIEDAHDQAWRSTLADAERTVIKTRSGTNGVAQLDTTSGVAAAAFRHYDSRAGDPNLHTHVAVPNRVKAADGRWRTIDSRALHHAAVSMSETYNTRVTAGVAQRLALATTTVDAGRGLRPVHEIAGIDPALTTAFASRGQSIAARTNDLIDQYVRDHGHQPAADIRHQLAQQATLETRPPKPHARSLATLRAEWRQRAVDTIGAGRVDRLLDDARAAATRLAPTAPPADLDAAGITAIAHASVEAVEQQRAVWTRFHLDAEVRRQVRDLPTQVGDDMVAAIVDEAVHRASIRVTMPSTEPTMPALTRADGESVFTHVQSVRYTSQRILDAETRAIDAARTNVLAPVAGERFDAVLHQLTTAGLTLDPGQVAVARAFACDSRLVVAGIGPAGTGKTTTMQAVARAVEATGGRLIGLAPSARAAAVFAEGVGVEAYTIHRWLHHRRNGTDDPAWQLNPGDIIVIDEAGMAGTLNIDAVIAEARAAGAVVRPLGDPQQLGSVESGGLLRLIQREAGAVELDHLWRFADPDEAAATLRLRDGTDDAWRWYWANDRIQHGDRDAMLDAVYRAWRDDSATGAITLMVAPTNDDTARLNDRARADRIAAGVVEPTGVPLHDGTQAGRGDQIVTRENDSRLRLLTGRDMVKNGDVWAVETRLPDGALVARHVEHHGRITLPATYVARHVELAYATTIHRAQGLTVERVHALLDATVSRVQAYVAMTRGKVRNTLYAITGPGERVHDVLAGIGNNFGASISATEAMRDSLHDNEHLPNLVNRYRYVADLAAEQRHRQALTTALGGTTVRELIRSGTYARIATALTRAERAGWTAPDILAAAGTRNLDDADDLAGLLAHRIRAAQDHTAARLAQAPQRPLTNLTDEALTRLRDRARMRVYDAETALAWAHHERDELPTPVRIRGTDHPAWPQRPHGALTDAQLADVRRDHQIAREHLDRRLGAARRAVADASTPEQADAAARHRARIEAQARAHRDAARELDAERTLRQRMRPTDRARETAQRQDRTIPATPQTLQQARSEADAGVTLTTQRVEQARTIIERIDQEAAWRRSLPTSQRQVEDDLRHGRRPAPEHPVPAWIADTRHVTASDTSPWAAHLDARREHLAQRLADLAREAAAQPPAWLASSFGPRPEDTAQAAAWDRATSLATGYRQLWNVPDDDTRLLGREPLPNAGIRRQAFEQARDAAGPVRAERARANRAAAAANARAELHRQLREAAEREPVDARRVRDAGSIDPSREQTQRHTEQDQQRRVADQDQQRRAAEEQQRRADDARGRAADQPRGPQPPRPGL
ncbi:MAG: relaxase domain-containing protein [Micromonosporaceae bacterium]|nr:relaxase domain-containing protein [Micromonosporaceae bacterium]